MNVLFDHASPFLLAHGGMQVQIEQTKSALENVGVAVEYLRWWDSTQTADLIHYFGRPNASYVRFAHGKNIPVIMTDLLTGLGSRPFGARLAQRAGIKFARSAAPSSLWNRMAWDAYGEVDRVLALTEWEAKLMTEMFGAPAARVFVVPNGVEDVFLRDEGKVERGPYLVCTATITERKRILELGAAAVRAGTPIRIIGKPYDPEDRYAQEFFKMAKQFPNTIRYEGALKDRGRLARIYREARGFVLLSTMESLSLSALEAAACGCPLLLSDLPWARTVFGDRAHYCPVSGEARTAQSLQEFYTADLPAPPRPLSWIGVADILKQIYGEVLRERPTRLSKG